MGENNGDDGNNWRDLFGELWRRLRRPIGYPAFILYFVTIIIIVGGLGTWLTMLAGNWVTVPSSISTYLLAIIAAAAADLILSKPKDNTKRTLELSLQMLALASLVIGTSLAVLTEFTEDFTAKYIFSILGSILALLLWWIANSDNEKLMDSDVDPFDSTGGRMTEEGNLSAIEGNLEGLEV